MLLGMISIVSFGLWGDFGKKNLKSAKNWKIWALSGLLRRSVGNPRCGVDPRQGVGYPRRDKAEVPKWHPSGMPRHSIAAPQRSYCSQRAIFGLLFQTPHIRTPIV